VAISFVAANTGSTGNNYASSYTVTKPTNTNGDLIVAILGGKGATLSGSGWTLLMQTSARSGGSMDQTSVYYKFASSEGTGSYTVTLSTSQLTTGWIGAYRGVSATTPIDTTNKSIRNTSGTSYSPTSVTSTSSQWAISFAIAYNFGTATVATYTETSPSPTFERADFGVDVSANPDNTAMCVAEYQSLAGGAFAPTITRNHTADTGDCGTLLLNNGSTNGEGDPDAPNVTVAAYDATTAQGVAAMAQVATLTVAANGVGVGVQGILDPTVKAWDASVKITASAEVATLSLNSGDKGITYGAPPGRTVKVGAENRTWKIGSENRVYVVEIGAID
jgi:hypothetical protein